MISIKSAMRMKPDHIVLAELHGDEAWSYIEALNTGSEGSITTEVMTVIVPWNFDIGVNYPAGIK